MQIFISIEGQNIEQLGLQPILSDISSKLKLLSNLDPTIAKNRYGAEITSIAIIPTCVDDGLWLALGWKERILFLRKRKEAEARLRMDYREICCKDYDGKRKMFVDVIIKSVEEIGKKSKGDFNCQQLISDILTLVSC